MRFRLGYLLNPLAALADLVNENRGVDEESRGLPDRSEAIPNFINQVHDKVEDTWEDYTGQTQIQQQLEANKELAAYQAQMNEEFYNKYSSPQALMRQYQEAGLNPNLMYGSAGSGQGNVPSYTAPSAPRNLSAFDKISKGLSLISGVMNLQNLFYNTAASREIAEQNGVKTLGLVEDVLSKRRNNAVEGLTVGYQPSFGLSPLFKGSVLNRRNGEVVAGGLPMLEQYSSAMRNSRINKAIKDMASNMFEYGTYYDGEDVRTWKPYEDWLANAIWRNKVLEFDAKQRQFTYDWDYDYKSILKAAGIASPIIQTILRLFGGK